MGNFSPTPNMIAEKVGPVGRLVFNKPHKHNATSTDMWEDGRARRSPGAGARSHVRGPRATRRTIRRALCPCGRRGASARGPPRRAGTRRWQGRSRCALMTCSKQSGCEYATFAPDGALVVSPISSSSSTKPGLKPRPDARLGRDQAQRRVPGRQVRHPPLEALAEAVGALPMRSSSSRFEARRADRTGCGGRGG